MTQYFLTEKEEARLRATIWLRVRRRSLYEYLCELPLEVLERYPKKGYYWWMGRQARSFQALEMRNYVLFWRGRACAFRQQYTRKYLETFSCEELQMFVRWYIHKIPTWAYEGPIQDALRILDQRGEQWRYV